MGVSDVARAAGRSDDGQCSHVHVLFSPASDEIFITRRYFGVHWTSNDTPQQRTEEEKATLARTGRTIVIRRRKVESLCIDSMNDLCAAPTRRQWRKKQKLASPPTSVDSGEVFL